jgi:hypothetical protein
MYLLKVFGIPCPRAGYLNNNGLFANENIFIGVAENSTSSSYS